MEDSSIANHVAWSAFALAFIFGAIANRANFCTMGSIADIVSMGSWTRMRLWLFAIAIAIIGAQSLHLAGIVNLTKSIYTGASFPLAAYIVGGVLFGVGMTMASGCGSKTLIRIGGGNLKSLVVLVFLGLSAYMTIKGLFGVWRIRVLEPGTIALNSNQDLPALVAAATGIAEHGLRIGLSAAIGVALIGFAVSEREFRSLGNLLTGLAIGLCIAGGWYVSGKLGYLAEDPGTLQEAFVATNSARLESFSFVAPAGYLLELLMFWSDTTKIVTFGIAATLGVIAGSFAYALASRQFRVESFRDSNDLINHIVGGILMGFGGVTALGCTIGQGLTGLSTLAAGSFVVFLSIVTGAAATMRYQLWRMSS